MHQKGSVYEKERLLKNYENKTSINERFKETAPKTIKG